jgi:transposase InsO family protein
MPGGQMPWKDMSVLQQRIEFLKAVNEQRNSFKANCKSFGISRKTGYKWLSRFKSNGLAGLSDLPKAPRHVHNKASPHIEGEIIAIKCKHPSWGARKLRMLLSKSGKCSQIPSESGIYQILARHNLTSPRKRKRRVTPYRQPFMDCNAPNDVWYADFKGQFKTGDGKYCYPLTVTDAFSRYIICCAALESTRQETARQVFESLFSLFGLPCAIRTDNGAPFASHGAGGLTVLSAWWVRNGIVHERIRPGKPQENGRHERMHKTLKAEATVPAKESLKDQQAEFDRFVHEFNHERPHEAIGMLTPADVYSKSGRVYKNICKASYAMVTTTRNIRTNGCVKWRGKEIFISEMLAGERLGLVPVCCDKPELFDVYYSTLKIGRLEGSCYRFVKI